MCHANEIQRIDRIAGATGRSRRRSASAHRQDVPGVQADLHPRGVCQIWRAAGSLDGRILQNAAVVRPTNCTHGSPQHH